MTQDLGGHDLVVQWPSDLPLDRLHQLMSFPVYAHPHHLVPARSTVWVASRGTLRARFRIECIGNAEKVKLMSGKSAPKGRRLHIRPGSVQILARPIRIDQIPVLPGATRNPGHGDGFVYMTRRPRAFIRTGPSTGGLKNRKIGLEQRHLEVWVEQSRGQRGLTGERVHLPAEGRLVLEYAAWMKIRGSNLVRLAIELPDGSEILTDAYDERRRLLIEAKSASDRPSIRMAVGQLFDYSRALEKRTVKAVLTPERPSTDLLNLLQSLGFHAIWRTNDGAFADSASGRLT